MKYMADIVVLASSLLFTNISVTRFLRIFDALFLAALETFWLLTENKYRKQQNMATKITILVKKLEKIWILYKSIWT